MDFSSPALGSDGTLYIGSLNGYLYAITDIRIVSTTPTNGATGISRTGTITIKFSENIKSSTYFNNITIKNLTTGQTITITKTIINNTLSLKPSSTLAANTQYQVTIPASGTKDYAGNNIQATYTFKFKTGT
jgi:hypothetical protein